MLVLGTFVFFAAEVFVDPRTGESLTGVGPVVVIILLGRELLVTTIRGLSVDGRGGGMGAKWAGKFKMVFQSVAIPVVLAYVIARGLFPDALARGTHSAELAARAAAHRRRLGNRRRHRLERVGATCRRGGRKPGASS